MNNQESVLHQAMNGNTRTTILHNGTKIREWETGTNPQPTHPESIDLKITDWCDAGCHYCHESSTRQGKHASYETINEILNTIPTGTEIAIGGGDPTSHPELPAILKIAKTNGLIPNITVNSRHITRSYDLLHKMQTKNLIHGIGISFHPKPKYMQAIAQAVNKVDSQAKQTHGGLNNTVIHFIAGNDNIEDAITASQISNILILGYKDFGKGRSFVNNKDVQTNIAKWRFWIGKLLSKHVGQWTVCFDNLALEQLCLQQKVKSHVWKERFMGDDGKFTMYIDAVTDTFAISSTHTRIPREDRTVTEMFQEIQRIS